MNLDFLKDLTLVETKRQSTSRAKLDISPAEGAQLRLFKDGRIFPSEDFTEDNSLEYVDKGSKQIANGLDIIDSSKFPNYPVGSPRVIFVSLVSKVEPKVDLFGSVGYNDDNTPKTSVLEQGAKTTGLWLIDLLTEVYGDMFGEEKYVDLVVNTEFGLTTPNNIYHMPKTVNRGVRKGEVEYIRRTDTTLWPLTVLDTSVVDTITIEEEEVNHTNETDQTL